mmetsp:Transcript_39896/g.124779  ORF Transcript_39896/g.124779 Transcript_39896/m.124779 type:complete len:210 (-) Transcript_39896:186-815(-)
MVFAVMLAACLGQYLDADATGAAAAAGAAGAAGAAPAAAEPGSGTRERPRTKRVLTEAEALVQKRLGLHDDAVITVVLNEELLILLEADEMEAASLRLLLNVAHSFIVFLVADAEEEKRVQARLEALGVCGKGGTVRPHRCLCCTTMTGKIAFVRQLEPAIHFDVEPRAARELKPHIAKVVGLGPMLADGALPEVFERIYVTPQGVVRA